MSKASFSQRVKESVTVKIIFILFMILLLLIPTLMIQNLIRERSHRKAEVEAEVAKSFGGAQRIMMPFIRVPYVTTKLDKDKKEFTFKGHLSFSPFSSEVIGDINTETRKRSIYEIVVYNSDLKIDEEFKLSSANLKEWSDCDIKYDQARLILGIRDSKGLQESSSISINGKDVAIEGNASISCRNMRWVESAPFAIDLESDLKVSSRLVFKGSKFLKFEPLGESMKVNIRSSWLDPSFVGNNLPISYDINDLGFESHWEVNKFSHSYPAIWSGDNVFNKDHSFGVNLIQPVDEYGKNERAAKYALLIISLTFGIFFFFEILFKKIIHPIQYTLIGFALTIFYLLLLSFTEHLGFDKSYIIASIGTIGLIVVYTKFILKSIKGSTIIGALLIALFSYIFIILQMQDFALLAGAIALFIILSTVMMLSRNVDWYNLKRQDSSSNLLAQD